MEDDFLCINFVPCILDAEERQKGGSAFEKNEMEGLMFKMETTPALQKLGSF